MPAPGGENVGVVTRALAAVPEPILVPLAIAGAVALVVRLFRSVARLGITAAEETAVSGVAENSARRGDLTTLLESQARARALRRARLREFGWAGGYIALLTVPALAGVAPVAYAASSLLWLLPRRPVRPRRPPAGDE